ncbi:hypothetical protein [Rhodococcus sp. APC 3903]|uniref:hypothetical protein n=1 Tax=Rhodococcus sp. APC 3903 TaxID=3035193 RepID=UPI0025B44214|nr:hypothetical protein [Rhodococcus sp. APC 3903]MDN3460673.1 hypothetical protein [Rhodococcus sp. APC 3903]
MLTTPTPDGAGRRLNVHKMFSSAGPFADFSVLIAKMASSSDGDSPDSYSAFLVDLDSPGCVAGSDVPVSGQHIEADIILDDCYVGPEQLLGNVGEGLRIGLGRVAVNWLPHCPTALGGARRALELSMECSKAHH